MKSVGLKIVSASVLLYLLLACSYKINNESVVGTPFFPVVSDAQKEKLMVIDPDKLELRYKLDTSYLSMSGKIMEFDCQLYNGNYDTLYFFTYSCYGWLNNFIVDSSVIQNFNSIMCNLSRPIIKSVAPKSAFEFKERFFAKNPNTKNIQFQYYIYQVNSNFDVKNSDSIVKLEKTMIKNAPL